MIWYLAYTKFIIHRENWRQLYTVYYSVVLVYYYSAMFCSVLWTNGFIVFDCIQNII